MISTLKIRVLKSSAHGADSLLKIIENALQKKAAVSGVSASVRLTKH